jgi:hypothetical protein
MRMTTRKLLAVTTGLLLSAGVPALAQNTQAPAGQPPGPSSDQGGAQGAMGAGGNAENQGTMAPTTKKHRHARRHKTPSSSSASTNGAGGNEGAGSNMGTGSNAGTSGTSK